MNIFFRFLAGIILFTYAVPYFSKEQLLMELLSDVKSKDTGELKKELKWIRAETSFMTEIATKTKTDSDPAPGIISLLHGDDLKKQVLSKDEDYA